MGTLDQRSSLIGAAIGLVVGGAGGFIAASQNVDPHGKTPPAGVAAPSALSPTVPSAAGQTARISSADLSQARPSFAQQGEDLVIQQMLHTYDIREPTYLDIGAHDPVRNSNTYLFYALGGHGVLVEPNPAYAEKLRKVRPRDKVLEVGVGVTTQDEADYYLISGDGQLNTFSKAQADSLVRVHHLKVEGVVKRKLVPINQVLEQNFGDRAPDVLSIDIEGMDYEILKTLDWTKWRPRIVCVETSEVETGKVEREILELLEKNGYTVRGGSFVNTIFLDERTPKKAASDANGAARGADAAVNARPPDAAAAAP